MPTRSSADACGWDSGLFGSCPFCVHPCCSLPRAHTLTVSPHGTGRDVLALWASRVLGRPGVLGGRRSWAGGPAAAIPAASEWHQEGDPGSHEGLVCWTPDPLGAVRGGPPSARGWGKGCTRRGRDHQRREPRSLWVRPPPPGPAGAAVTEYTDCGGAHTAEIHSLLVVEANIGGQGVAKLVLPGLRVWATICPGSPSLWWCWPSSVQHAGSLAVACGILSYGMRTS